MIVQAIQTPTWLSIPQCALNIADLTLEREVAQRALAGMEVELRRLLPLVDCCDQTPTESAIAVNEHIGQAKRRLKDLSQELASLENQAVDEDEPLPGGCLIVMLSIVIHLLGDS
jgi:hypothetical protein